MKKLSILLAVAAVAASSTGCGCCGRIRNLFHKGSPCGTSMAPVALGAPLAMSAPVMTTPVMQSAPVCCVPCDPCADPCAQGVTSGYFGGYMNGGDCGCADGGAVTTVPSTMSPTTVMPYATGDGN